MTDKYVCTLNKKLIEKAKKELGEKPERRDADIEAIRTWLRQNPYIRADTSARNILSFLRVCKFSLQRTKERIELYYSVKTAIPEFFTGFDPLQPNIRHCLKTGMMLPLEGVDKEGRRVILSRSGVIGDPDKIDINDVMKYCFMVYAYILKEWEEVAVSGLVIVQDNKNYNAALLKFLTPTFLKKCTRMWNDCMPFRFKASHNVHTSGVFMTAYKIFKPFIKEKMRNRMFLHGDNFDALYEHVPKNILPNEYGGTAGKIQDLVDALKKKIEADREWFLEQENYRTEESKRPGPKRDLEAELFGIEGSFRKLDID